MSNYYAGLQRLRDQDPVMAQRCATRLLALRESLEPLRQSKSRGSLLLATWNIRDFDSNKFGFGPRLEESFYYLAEIISCFDLVAVQEVNRDLSGLERLMRILGFHWDYIATDPTEGSGGNDERMAFLFDKRVVTFRKIAGEVVLPDGQLIVSPKKAAKKPKIGQTSDPGTNEKVQEAVASGFGEVRQQFARTPFVVAFQSGWFKFSLCTVHIYYGDDSGAQLKRRIAEIERLVGFFATRQDKENQAARGDAGRTENYILLGDFNVVSPEHETMKALKSHGFMVPPAIDGVNVRTPEQHFYDQIAVRVKDARFRVLRGGLNDPFSVVFRDTAEEMEAYTSFMPASDPESNRRRRARTPEGLYRKWRTWQMSDHSPLWVELATDFTDHYLTGFTS